MPHLVQMDKKLRDKGLFIVAPESQGSSKDRIQSVKDNAKIDFTITSGVNGPVQVRGIPSALVFDVTGKMIYQGHPSSPEFDKTVKTALKDVKDADEQDEAEKKEELGPLIDQRKWTNSDGKTISASVVKYADGVLTFKLYNNKIVDYEIGNLSEADQEMIKKAAEDRVKETAEEE